MEHTITPVRVLSDNYAWIVPATDTRRVAVVDPGDSGPVEKWLQAQAAKLLLFKPTRSRLSPVMKGLWDNGL